MAPGAYLMAGNQGETWDTIQATVDLLKNIGTGDVYNVGVAQLYPNTQLYALAVKQGQLDDGYWLTRRKVPYYTAENSLAKLHAFADAIKYRTWRNRGRFWKCARYYIVHHPRWAFEMLLRLFLYPPLMRGGARPAPPRIHHDPAATITH